MLRLGAFSILAEDYPAGFFITFNTEFDDRLCGNNLQNNAPRIKSFEYIISNEATSKDIIESIILTFVVFIGFSMIILMVAYCYAYSKNKVTE